MTEIIKLETIGQKPIKEYKDDVLFRVTSYPCTCWGVQCRECEAGIELLKRGYTKEFILNKIKEYT